MTAAKMIQALSDLVVKSTASVEPESREEATEAAEEASSRAPSRPRMMNEYKEWLNAS